MAPPPLAPVGGAEGQTDSWKEQTFPCALLTEEDGNVVIDRSFFTVGFEPTNRILHICTKIICKVLLRQFISLQSEVDIHKQR